MTELTVILKDSDRTYKQDFIIYESYSISDTDPLILACIDEAKQNFQGDPESVQIKIHMEIQ
jgi:hypothetical protein